MVGGIIAFSRGTAATMERQKPSYRPFLNDVRSGNLAGLPDRLRDVVQRMQDAGGKAGAGAKISDVLAAFAGTGNQFVMNTASRLAEAAEAGVFSHPEAHKIMKELMRQCPAAADSVPKLLADLRRDLGDGFYGLRDKDIVRIAGRSIRASGSHCPKAIHLKMAELTIRGEFDRIPQMHALRAEKAMAPKQAVAVNEFATCTAATRAPVSYAEFRPAQAVSDHYSTSVAEKQIPLKLMEFKAPQQMQNTTRLRSTPLAEPVIVRETIRRAPRAADLPPVREPVLRGREEHRAPVKPAEPQAKILKPAAAGAEARQRTPEPARGEAQKARPAIITLQRMEKKKEKRLKSSERTVRLPEAGCAPAMQAAKPAPLKRLREKLRLQISRVRGLARSAKSRIAAKRAEAKKRRELKPVVSKRVPKKKEKHAPAAAKRIPKRKGKAARIATAVKFALRSSFRMKMGKAEKGRAAFAGKRAAPQAHGPAMFRRMARMPWRRGKARPRFLKFLIAPGFFSPRRQRRNSAVRARNAF
ncbi:MAG: hypothetical protein PHV13_03265 [Candidatus ainarchaeum sp.]|nr:hypothetical protein [Candidatus ainarchaeum sp.]